MSSGTPYIGSKISLISKAGIRYEGFLYTIDTNESTVTLSQVRSFGTEERHSKTPVAPRDEVYNYIIFRGSDISDLHVCEAPKQPSSLAQDPAILQHSSASASVPSFHPPASFSNAPPPAPFAPFGNVPYGHQYPPMGGMMPGHFPGQGHQASALHELDRHTPPLRRSPTMEQGVQASENVSSGSQKDDTKSGSKTESSNKTKGNIQRHQQQQRKRTSSREDRPPSRDSQQNERNHHHHQDNKEKEARQSERQTTHGANKERQGSTSNHNQQNRRGRGGRGRNPRSPAGREVPKDDFDFQTANDGFDKTLLEEEFQNKLKIVNGDEVKKVAPTEEDVEGGEEGSEEANVEQSGGDVIDPEEDPTFYAPEKSFFDSISCEALDRGSRQRSNWKEERKLNVETFGFMYSRGRGRGRGYRGGGYRGGGYRGGYNRGGYNRGGYNREYNRGGRGNYRGNRDGRGGGWKNPNWRDNRDYQGDNRNKNEENRRTEAPPAESS